MNGIYCRPVKNQHIEAGLSNVDDDLADQYNIHINEVLERVVK